MSVERNLLAIRARIEAAARKAGRDPSSVTLMGVSKRQPDERVLEAYEAGLRDFGENTVQELARKATLFAERGLEPRWHFIGHLQRNKINKLLEHPIHRLHSVDSSKLASALGKRAPERGLDVLVEVNVGEEPQKGGVMPVDLEAVLDTLAAESTLRMRGLMAIPPAEDDPKPHFLALARLLGEHRSHPAMAEAAELSMGMSSDFETAIECGSTIVRVGTALFGARDT